LVPKKSVKTADLKRHNGGGSRGRKAEVDLGEEVGGGSLLVGKPRRIK